MSVEEYFSIMIWVLMGLTFIAISLIFLYMVYGEKEESSDTTKSTTALNFISSWTNKIFFRL
jgi:flagellar basal body-associated protein FliL